MLDFSPYYMFFLVCGLSGVNSAFTVERGGSTTNDREFCIGDQLTFRCIIALSSYSWTVTGFLDGTVGNGRVTIGDSEVDGEFMLSASGVNAARMSSLQVTVFEGLVGDKTITCRDAGTTMGGQSVNISILNPVSAPSITATGTEDISSFHLMTTPPTTSPQCFTNYYLVVRQGSEVVANVTVAKQNLDYRTVDVRDIINIPIITCMYTYTFELTPVTGKFSSGDQHGNPNLRAVTSSSDQYGIQNGVVSWEPAKAFSNIPKDCISGYQYTINDTIIGTVFNPAFTLDCSFTDVQSCAANTLTIRPIVMAGNSVLNNVVVTGHTCNRDPLLQTESTASLITTQSSLKSCNVNIGALAGVTSVALLCLIISVVVVITLAVANKRLRLKLVQQEGQSQNDIVGTKSHMSSVNITSDIGMVKCQAYGEVAVRNRASEINELSNNAGVYEHI